MITNRSWTYLISFLVCTLFFVSSAVHGCSPSPSPTPPSFIYQVRVKEKDKEKYIADAKVTIELASLPPLDATTDSTGLAVIPVPYACAEKLAKLIVRATGYKEHSQHINLIPDLPPQVIQLELAEINQPCTEPILLSPQSGDEIGGKTVEFCWRRDPDLKQDERFELQMWRPGKSEMFSIKQTSKSYFRDHPPHGFGNYVWRVAVVCKTATGGWEELCASAQSPFLWIEPPTAVFISSSPDALGAATFFTNTSTGNDPGFEWDFGDDSAIVTIVSPTHTYTTTGTFTVILTATNKAGLDTASASVVIEEPPPERISGLRASNDGPTVLGHATTLTAMIETGTNVSYNWDLEDVELDNSGPTIMHTYDKVGTFTATVTATNSVDSESASTQVIVEEAISGLTACNDGPAVLGSTTTLTATVESGSNVSYTWDFGDGNRLDSIDSTVTHTYTKTGPFTATVTATNHVSTESTTTIVEVKITPCTPDASLVAHVTVPHGTQFSSGQTFTKTWRIRSSGCAPWPAGTVWAFVSGSRMSALQYVSVPQTALGDTADIPVAMVAPGTPGPYTGCWQMRDPSGIWFGDQAYVKIVVTTTTPPPPTLTCPPNSLVPKIKQGHLVPLRWTWEGTLDLEKGDVYSVRIWHLQGGSSSNPCCHKRTTETAHDFDPASNDEDCESCKGGYDFCWEVQPVRLNPNPPPKWLHLSPPSETWCFSVANQPGPGILGCE